MYLVEVQVHRSYNQGLISADRSNKAPAPNVRSYYSSTRPEDSPQDPLRNCTVQAEAIMALVKRGGSPVRCVFCPAFPGVSDACRKVDVRLPGKGNSNSHGARPVHLINTMIQWIRTSRLSIQNSLSAGTAGCPGQRTPCREQFDKTVPCS